MAKKDKEKQPREMTRRQLSHHKRQLRRQKIILFGGIAVLIAVVLLVMAGWYFGDYAPFHTTIVQVYESKISEQDFISTLEYYGQMYAMYGQSFDISAQADYVMSSMVQDELIRRGAEQLGFTVTNQEINNSIGSNTTKLNNGQKAIITASLLSQKLETNYFGKQIGDSGNQVMMNAMMVESADIVPQIRDKLLSGDNFTLLAPQYALNSASISNNGTFPWHPSAVLSDDLGTSIPVDWAFSDNVTKGDISPALTDNVTSKEVGYWLIKVTSRSNSENISSENITGQALLVSSEAQAKYVKTLLESTDNISSIVDQYDQYSNTKTTHGDLGTILASDNISDAFNGYAFSANATIGSWSDPIKDTYNWTTGGAWIVQIVDKAGDRPYSSDDKTSLVSKAYNAWANGLWANAATDIKYEFSDAQKQFAIDEANKYISKVTGNTGQ